MSERRDDMDALTGRVGEAGDMRALFSRRARWIILALGGVSMLLSMVFGLWFDPRERVDSAHADTFSESAIGHRALVRLLREVKIPAVVSRYHTARKARDGSLLVLAEPHISLDPQKHPTDPSNRRFKKMLDTSRATLVVLPKWDGRVDPERKKWLKSVRPVSSSARRFVLRGVGGQAGAVTVYDGGDVRGWTRAPGISNAPYIKHRPQLLKRSAGLRPIVSASGAGDEGVLLAQVVGVTPPVYLLSDPDVLANHGLHQRDNARFTAELIQLLREGEGAVIVDEMLHGHILRPSLFREMLRFPFLLLTLQLVLFALGVLWAGVRRFGPPHRPPAVQQADLSFFIQNTAELIDMGKHDAFMTEAYVRAQFEQVARGLGAPRDLSAQELVVWLQEQTSARAETRALDLAELVDRVADMSAGVRRTRPGALQKIARQVHAWREEMLRES